jgi:prepilin-type N-terminal cleavage/methylation domain-containing protein/prepilin-type processing-associated H-X9-DG protein
MTRTVRRRGFTLLELMVAIGIGLILLSIFVPYALSWRESNRRTRCADNLRQLQSALWSYAAERGRISAAESHFPRTRYDAERMPDGYTAYTGSDDANPFADNSGVKPNDVTASLWLLVREGYVPDPVVFVCPSSTDSRDLLSDAQGRPVEPKRRGNFRLPENLSYGYASPFGSAPEYKLTDTLPGGFALMADKSPGVDAGAIASVRPSDPPAVRARGNSLNHGQAGQNVLYADGSVRWMTHPFVGIGWSSGTPTDGDNIYTALAPRPLEPGTLPAINGTGVWGREIGPAWSHDSYIVPTERERAAPREPATAPARVPATARAPATTRAAG